MKLAKAAFLTVLLLAPAEGYARDKKKVRPKIGPANSRLEIVAPSLTAEGKAIRFVSKISHTRGKQTRKLKYHWRFGDGKSVHGKRIRTRRHRFKHPGSFVVSLTISRRGTTLFKAEKLVTVLDLRPPQTRKPNPSATPHIPGTGGAPVIPAPTAVPREAEPPPIDPPSGTPSAAPTVPENPGTPPGTRTPTPTATRTRTPTPTPTPSVPVGYIRKTPAELTGILSNPGMGLQSGDQVVTSGLTSQGYPIKVAYVKFYWHALETAAGVYDWSNIDRYLNQAKSAGQKLALRIVTHDNVQSGPAWLRNLGVRGYWYYDYADNGPNSARLWMPDFNDTAVQSRHFAFLRELGRRYNGDPAIDAIDIGSIGLWGEWHLWGLTPTIAMPTQATLRAVVDTYFTAFPNKPKLIQVSDKDIMKYAVGRGAGYRADCLGWIDNHMKWLYDPNIAYAGAENAWRNAPINFESCWDVAHWVNQGWDLNWIVNWALDHHISGFNNKNRAIPTSARTQFDRLMRSMGYRYVLVYGQYPQTVRRGTTFTLSMDWRNKGVAPSYGNHVLGIRLRASPSSAPVVLIATANRAKDWMPGAFFIDQSVAVPATIAAGAYELSIAVVNPANMSPEIQLASAGRDTSGWYPLGTINVN